MSSYLSNISKPVVVVAWCVVLTAALWTLSATASPVALFALLVIGLAPPAVLLTLARRPALTTAEAVRAVYAGRAD
jgi:hypothetical protein